MLHKLIFDTTDANTIADSHSVGAYLRSSDGTLLTHTDVGGKQALDVRVAEGINVEVDLSHVDDSVKIGDGTEFLLINVDGSINAVVTATDLDIRDLVHTQDSVRLGDGSTFYTSTTVGADVGLDVNIINATLTVNDAALANTSIATASNLMNVADTAENLVTAPLANRKYLWAYNNSNRTAYIGASGVTAANGFPLPPGSYVTMRAGDSIDIEWVSNQANADMRTMELA